MSVTNSRVSCMVKQTSNLQTMYLVYKQNVGYKFPSVSLFEKHFTLKSVWQEN